MRQPTPSAAICCRSSSRPGHLVSRTKRHGGGPTSPRSRPRRKFSRRLTRGDSKIGRRRTDPSSRRTTYAQVALSAQYGGGGGRMLARTGNNGGGRSTDRGATEARHPRQRRYRDSTRPVEGQQRRSEKS